VAAVAPALQGNAEVSFGGELTNTQVVGATPEYLTVSNYQITEGEYITEEHILGRASVVLIGPDVADKLFDRREGVTGETVRIEGQPFRVLGVLESRGGGTFGSQDDLVIVPFSTAQTRLIRRGASDRVDIILVQTVDADSVDQAIEEISQILRTRHRTPVGADDFTVFSQRDLLATFESITGILTIFLGGIAAISLLVGGIGIMNIMLVSVTERTREIGLRKALGARKRDILIQFLTESSLLSLIGGIIGILFGWFIAYVVGQIAAASNTDFTPVVGGDAILLATLFSAAVGLFFGIYPASRAANLEPVEALRYE
jgi:putative ABC transport system permease protein